MHITAVICIFIIVVLGGTGAQFVDAEVGDFDDKSIVDDTVRTLQPTVRSDVGIVQVRHTLNTPLSYALY